MENRTGIDGKKLHKCRVYDSTNLSKRARICFETAIINCLTYLFKHANVFFACKIRNLIPD